MLTMKVEEGATVSNPDLGRVYSHTTKVSVADAVNAAKALYPRWTKIFVTLIRDAPTEPHVDRGS